VTESPVDRFLAELRSSPFFGGVTVPYSFEYMSQYYARHSGKKRFKFRVASVTLIVLGALLPVWAAFGGDFAILGTAVSKDLSLSAMSAAIAILTAILAHFRWELGWKVQTEALFELQEFRAQWDTAVASARAADDSQAAVAELRQAFDVFRSHTYETVKTEMRDYFTAQKPPALPERTQP
jgi:hypothetical protein